MKKPIILTDLDDTLFPFAGTWAEWHYTTTGEPIDEAMYWYYDVDAYLHNFLEKQKTFIDELHLFKPLPVEKASETLMKLSEDFQVIALTARNHDEWSNHTEEWVKLHAPYISDIHYTRKLKGEKSVPKALIADKLKAKALIDDTSHWINSLPSHIKGYVIQRPKPFPSDEGAVSWDFVYEDLSKLLNKKLV